MSAPPVKTRFAPSPTGYIHLGNARTALFSALLARKADGVFLLRIEDTDLERSRSEYAEALEEDLEWLGLLWQEGPGVGGEHGPYAQSQRTAIYGRLLAQLEQAGLAYPCFCSDRELELSRKAQLAAGQPPRYAGTCAQLSPGEVRARLDRGLKPTLRFRVPEGQSVEFEDLVRGPQRFDTGRIGDFVIRRSDGTSAFFFTNAVDDALMGVTHVLRGEDHLTNTPRQLLLLRALDLPAPRYGHIALIVGPNGGPLSKREGSASVRDLRARGYLPLALDNHLARLGHHYDSDALMDLDGLAAGFDPSRLGRAPARHDEGQLRHWQKEAVARLGEASLWRWLRDYDAAAFAAVPAGAESSFVEAVRDNVVLPADAVEWARRIFTDELPMSEDARASVRGAGEEFFRAALACLVEPTLEFKPYAKSVGEATGRKGKDLFMPLRAALTGELHGPEMGRMFPLIGPERARRRLQGVIHL